ncbi:PilN domain-containing protein [bacterium]|nr:PilN domain-containing protein [bacterium]
MFNKLFSGDGHNQIVGFSLTPGIGLEAVILDKTKTKVLNYGRKKVDYNFSQRNIQDYLQFKTALSELVKEMHIKPKSYTYMVLPNVFFDFIELTNNTTDENIDMALTASAEDYYIFKRDEPVIGWSEIAANDTQKRIAYSAFQRTDIEEIKRIFETLNLQLIGIETSYSATLKGINLTGLISDAIVMNSAWTALIINTNSFTLFQMEGKSLIDCNDVPLAIKSFSPEEAYQAITSSVSQLLDNFPSNQLFIVSQTEDISADALKKIMQYDRDIVAIESNRYAGKPLLEVIGAVGNFKEASSMTLAALGAADSKSDLGIDLNIMGKKSAPSLGSYSVNLLGKQQDISTTAIAGASIGSTVVLLVIIGALIGGCYYWETTQKAKLDELNAKSAELERKIEELKKIEAPKPVETEIDMTDVIDSVANKNVQTIKFYDSISSDIPKNIWLTKYYNKSGNRVVIRGVAENIVDIYEYYKNLRVVSPQSDIKLTELKVVTGSQSGDEDNINDIIGNISIDRDVDRLYSFEISNTSVQLDMSMYTRRAGGKDQANNEVPKIDESDLLKGPPRINIEQPSDQMQPEQ